MSWSCVRLLRVHGTVLVTLAHPQFVRSAPVVDAAAHRGDAVARAVLKRLVMLIVPSGAGAMIVLEAIGAVVLLATRHG